MMNPLMERSNSSENVSRNSGSPSFFRSSGGSSPVAIGEPNNMQYRSPPTSSTQQQQQTLVAQYTPCNSQHLRQLQQDSSLKVRVNDPYARTVKVASPHHHHHHQHIAEGTYAAAPPSPLSNNTSIVSCPSLDVSEESVGRHAPSSPSVVTPNKVMTRVYYNGRPIPAFQSGELAVSVILPTELAH